MTTHTIQAGTEARALLESYFNEVVDRRKAGELADVGQYASRWCEQAARIALSLHAGLYGATAHQHALDTETAENGIRLARWFAAQQLALLAKGRRQAAAKVEDEVIKLLADRAQGRRLEPTERQQAKTLDYVTVRNVVRARIVTTAEAAHALLTRMVQDGLLIGEAITPPGGGKTTRIFRAVKNPVPE